MRVEKNPNEVNIVFWLLQRKDKEAECEAETKGWMGFSLSQRRARHGGIKSVWRPHLSLSVRGMCTLTERKLRCAFKEKHEQINEQFSTTGQRGAGYFWGKTPALDCFQVSLFVHVHVGVCTMYSSCRGEIRCEHTPTHMLNHHPPSFNH